MTNQTVTKLQAAKDSLQITVDAFESARDEAVAQKDFGIVSRLHNAAGMARTMQARIGKTLENNVAK